MKVNTYFSINDHKILNIEIPSLVWLIERLSSPSVIHSNVNSHGQRMEREEFHNPVVTQKRERERLKSCVRVPAAGVATKDSHRKKTTATLSAGSRSLKTENNQF